MSGPPRVALAFSGTAGSDPVGWLRQHRGAEVIAVTIDFGHGKQLESVRDRAVASGARRAHVLDARDEFLHDFALPALKAGVLDGVARPLDAALGRMLIAKKLVEIAQIEDAAAVAHSMRQPEQAAALARAVAALDPTLEVIAVPNAAAPADAAAAGAAAPTAETAVVEIAFECGQPVAVNGVEMPLAEMITALGTIAAANGVGANGAAAARTSGGGFDVAAAVVLHAAHQALKERALAPEALAFSRFVTAEYTRLVVDGGWFSALREGLDAFLDRVLQDASGTARMQLRQGTIRCCD